MLFWRGWWYAIDNLYHCFVSPLSYSGDRSLLLSMRLAEEGLEPGPCLEVGGLSSRFSNVFVEFVFL